MKTAQQAAPNEAKLPTKQFAPQKRLHQRCVFISSLAPKGATSMKKALASSKCFFPGALWGTRTLGLLGRSQSLYPTELTAHGGSSSTKGQPPAFATDAASTTMESIAQAKGKSKSILTKILGKTQAVFMDFCVPPRFASENAAENA